MNRRFGKLNEANEMVYAPDVLRTGDLINCSPKASDYRAHGYVRIVTDNRPSSDNGVSYVENGWKYNADKTQIECQWAEVANLTCRRWTRLKIKTALANAGWLPQVQQSMLAIEYAPDYSVWQALNDADYIEEFYPSETRWNRFLDEIATAIGKTRDEINAFLDNIPSDAE